jgi:hypothetical protein
VGDGVDVGGAAGDGDGVAVGTGEAAAGASSITRAVGVAAGRGVTVGNAAGLMLSGAAQTASRRPIVGRPRIAQTITAPRSNAATTRSQQRETRKRMAGCGIGRPNHHVRRDSGTGGCTERASDEAAMAARVAVAWSGAGSGGPESAKPSVGAMA